jgi:hypothetical protein
VYLRTAILNAKGVEITSARFLNPDPEARSLKLASSVVVTTTPEEGKKMGSNIFLLSRKREVKTAQSAPYTIAKRNTAALTPHVPRRATYVQWQIAALLPLRTVLTAGMTILPLTLPAQLDQAVPPH